MSTEKAILLNGILNFLDSEGHLTDMSGHYDINDSQVVAALRGLEKQGYIKIIEAEDVEGIQLVCIMPYGSTFIKKGKFI